MVCIFWILQRMVQRKAALAKLFCNLLREKRRERKPSRDLVMNSPSRTTEGVSPLSSDTFRKGFRKSLFWWRIVRRSLHLPTLQRRMFFLHRWYSLLCTGGQVFTAGHHLLPNALYAAGFHKHAGGLPLPQGKGNKPTCFALMFLLTGWYTLLYPGGRASHSEGQFLRQRSAAQGEDGISKQECFPKLFMWFWGGKKIKMSNLCLPVK